MVIATLEFLTLEALIRHKTSSSIMLRDLYQNNPVLTTLGSHRHHHPCYILPRPKEGEFENNGTGVTSHATLNTSGTLDFPSVCGLARFAKTRPTMSLGGGQLVKGSNSTRDADDQNQQNLFDFEFSRISSDFVHLNQ